MKVGIYSPYRKTLGGGEQYLFTIASILLNAHDVTFYSEDRKIIEEAEKRFDLPLTGLKVSRPVFETGNMFQKALNTHALDVLFYCSDGSIPVSFAKKTFLLFQFPTPWVKISLFEKLKMSSNTRALVYSEYVKGYIQKTYSIPTIVFSPGINVKSYRCERKERIILSVGRFTKGMNHKRQDVLIDAFKQFTDSGEKGWKLILAGGMLDDDTDLLESLAKRAEGYAIELIPNIARKELLSLYARASFYWHASGYQVDVTEHPELVEHFGITTLEAMASETIPLVFPEGGQRELITDGENGFVWRSLDELVAKTKKLIEHSENVALIRKRARKFAEQYDITEFRHKLIQLLEI